MAQRFACSDEEAAQELGTKEAIRRLGIQKSFDKLCKQDNVSKSELEELYKKGIDIRFTTLSKNPLKDNFPIFYALKAGNVSAVEFLLNKGVDINNVDKDITALSPAILRGKNKALMVKMLLKRPGILIKKSWKRTPLDDIIVHAVIITSNDNNNENKEIIKLLLEAGAAPESIFTQKLLPSVKDKEIVAMINNAVAKKHSRK